MQTDMHTAWEVAGVDGYNKPLCAPVYLTASSQDAARRAGRELLRAFGVPGRMLRRMRARVYRPDEDREWCGYLNRLPNGAVSGVPAAGENDGK